MAEKTNPNADVKFSIKEDIHLSDKDGWNTFQQYYIQGNYSNAINFVNNNLSTLKNKVSNATLVNNLNNAFTVLQNYYYINVEDKLKELQENYDYNIQNFISKGVFTVGETYYPLNFATDNSGNLYICIKENTAVENGLTDSENWLYIGLKGEKGYLGFDCTYRGVYDETVTYNKNDLCIDGDYLYYSKQDNNTGNAPSTTSQYWGVFFEFITSTIDLYTQAPSSPYEGQIYLLQL